MSKGFALSLVSIFVVVFISVPLAFFFVLSKDRDDSSVKGIHASQIPASSKGLLLKVKATGGTWDLFEYLCETEEECLSSLTAGYEWGSVSGGITEGHEVVVEPNDEWEKYKFMKVFVKVGWGSVGSSFKVLDEGSVPGTKVEPFKHKLSEYAVVILPLEDVKERFYESITFSD